MDRTEKGVVDSVVVIDDGPAATTSGFAVVVLDDRKLPSDADFTTRKEQLQVEAVKGKQFEVREAFLKALKAKATVTTNDKAIDKVIGGES
jgi:hypothetical protein